MLFLCAWFDYCAQGESGVEGDVHSIVPSSNVSLSEEVDLWDGWGWVDFEEGYCSESLDVDALAEAYLIVLLRRMERFPCHRANPFVVPGAQRPWAQRPMYRFRMRQCPAEVSFLAPLGSVGQGDAGGAWVGPVQPAGKADHHGQAGSYDSKEGASGRDAMLSPSTHLWGNRRNGGTALASDVAFAVVCHQPTRFPQFQDYAVGALLTGGPGSWNQADYWEPRTSDE